MHSFNCIYNDLRAYNLEAKADFAKQWTKKSNAYHFKDLGFKIWTWPNEYPHQYLGVTLDYGRLPLKTNFREEEWKWNKYHDRHYAEVFWSIYKSQPREVSKKEWGGGSEAKP